MDKLSAQDIPAAIPLIIQKIREGLRATFDNKIAQVQAPDKVDFNFAVIIRKDDLTRTEITARDPTTTTINSGTSTDTDTRITAAGRVTDETENMNFTRTGGETGGESGTESGGTTGGQSVAHSDSGGEIESYTYENV